MKGNKLSCFVNEKGHLRYVVHEFWKKSHEVLFFVVCIHVPKV